MLFFHLVSPITIFLNLLLPMCTNYAHLKTRNRLICAMLAVSMSELNIIYYLFKPIVSALFRCNICKYRMREKRIIPFSVTDIMLVRSKVHFLSVRFCIYPLHSRDENSNIVVFSMHFNCKIMLFHVEPMPTSNVLCMHFRF